MSDRLDEIRARWAAATPGTWRETGRLTTEEVAAQAAAADDVAYLLAEAERLRNEDERAASAVGHYMAESARFSDQRDAALAEVALLRALLAEPSEEEAERFATNGWEAWNAPSYASTTERAVAFVHSIFTDLRERAGGGE